MQWYKERLKVRCPFYVDHTYPRRGSEPKISCEAPESWKEEVDVQLRFKNKEIREAHMWRYCWGRYEACPYFKMKEMAEENEQEQNK